MSGGSWMRSEVQCPFFKFDDGRRRITCEGIFINSSLALIYHSRKDFETQMQVFCCEHYKNCEIYRMLMDKYEED